jgi:hypothetical protein
MSSSTPFRKNIEILMTMPGISEVAASVIVSEASRPFKACRSTKSRGRGCGNISRLRGFRCHRAANRFAAGFVAGGALGYYTSGGSWTATAEGAAAGALAGATGAFLGVLAGGGTLADALGVLNVAGAATGAVGGLAGVGALGGSCGAAGGTGLGWVDQVTAKDAQILLAAQQSAGGPGSFINDLNALAEAVGDLIPGGQVHLLGDIGGSPIYGSLVSRVGIVAVDGVTQVVSAPLDASPTILGPFHP